MVRRAVVAGGDAEEALVTVVVVVVKCVPCSECWRREMGLFAKTQSAHAWIFTRDVLAVQGKQLSTVIFIYVCIYA